MDKLLHSYTIAQTLKKKRGILSFEVTWMILDHSMLREINLGSERHTHDHLVGYKSLTSCKQRSKFWLPGVRC